MTKSFDDLKKFAISDILSVSGKDKVARVIENHMNNLIEVALIKGAQSKQAKIAELQKRIDLAIERINIFYMTNGMSDLTHDEIYGILKGTTNEQ